MRNQISLLLLVALMSFSCSYTDNANIDDLSAERLDYDRKTFIGIDYTFDNQGLNRPRTVRLFEKTSEIFVLDFGNSCFYVFDLDGTFKRTFGRKGRGPAELLNPLNFDMDSDGNIYVYELGNFRISTFKNSGEFIDTFPLRQAYFDLEFRLFVTDSGEILVNLPERGYYFTVLDNNGSVIRDIGKIPEEIFAWKQGNGIFSVGWPFYDEANEKYYFFSQKHLKIFVFDQNGSVLNEYDLDRVLMNERVRKFFVDPLERVRNKETISLGFISDIVYKDDNFYIVYNLKLFDYVI